MEFQEDFVKLFKKPLCTLPSVGLPTLLAYRPESSQEKPQAEAEEDLAPRCEYCGSLLKPFPALENPSPAPQNFCCEHRRDLYEFIISERRNHEDALRAAAAAVSSHKPASTKAERQLAKDRACQGQQERLLAKQLSFLAAETQGTAVDSSQADSISYLLSREPPSPTGRTLVPGEQASGPEEPKEELKEEPISSLTCCDFTLVGGKVVKNELSEKYYRDGGKFLTTLPDGTAQLLYPSGNLAVVVVRHKAQLVCIVQEDKPSKAKIQAVFQSRGRSTCYYPSGATWINMDPRGGQYFNQQGNRVRRWRWPSTLMPSEPQVPLSPIFISLNQYVGVRILEQDKIIISFLAMGRQVKFNVGTKVQVSSWLRPPTPPGEGELLLLAFRVRILRLLDRLRGCLTFPSTEQWDKIKPPAFLTTETWKILDLCTCPGVSKELRSLVQAIVNAEG
ncbi:glutamate-rich protein 6 [Dryobates pubescens]|uniref:glutamate-rich protein 6 n=1 Tax=Dryobates pubescens TaxID=118200 RepID=UPI0023B8D1E2|nr:glutamate-rich protein 6 [Dryobates pubescens]